MFELNTKKIYTKYDKICIFEKSPHKNYHGEKEILSWMIWDLSVIQQEHALTWPSLYRLIFQSLYDTSLISRRWEIDETVNFQNFCKLFTNKCAIFLGILAPYFEVAGCMKHAAMAVS